MATHPAATAGFAGFAGAGGQGTLFALCRTEVTPQFTAVTCHAAGLAINLNHNVRQSSIDAADAVARSTQGLQVDACGSC